MTNRFVNRSELIGILVLAVFLVVILPLCLDVFRLNLVAKYLTYAFVALGLVICWGYGGILSLGQGVFFGLGCGIAGIAGSAFTMIGSTGPTAGQLYIVDTFLVVVFGGAQSLLGTIASALTISQSQSTLEFFLTGSMAKVLTLLIVIGIGSALSILLVSWSSANTWTSAVCPGFGATIGNPPAMYPVAIWRLHALNVLPPSRLQVPPPFLLVPLPGCASTNKGS